MATLSLGCGRGLQVLGNAVGGGFNTRRVGYRPMVPTGSAHHTARMEVADGDFRANTRANAQHAIDPRTGAAMRYGPAMADKAVGIELPGLRQLFADITQ